jgi:ABC-type cobalamin/Fe3+-siderophores transport system ATPase subunit
MKLLKFRVTNFRSVDDSGWVDVDDVTALIGTNESGKTNVLLPLWKLNPAKEGAIDLTSDYPRKHYNTFRTLSPQPVFVEAVFDGGTELSKQLATLTGMPAEQMSQIHVSRRFDGTHVVDFPDAKPPRAVAKERVTTMLSQAEAELSGAAPLSTEAELKIQMLSTLTSAKEKLMQLPEIGTPQLDELARMLATIKTDPPAETSSLVPRFQRLTKDVAALKKELTHAHPREKKEAVDLVVKKLPKFVYYANYGNLDSEIYLPHVIANLKRTDMGAKDQAKARTLRVLFEFVKLQPQEILDLGQEPSQSLNPDQAQQVAEKKRQRTILLQSASADLTTKFRDWWKQGKYRFRFQADGSHFRIWVSDDKRPEEIELEGRSTGLRWFLSFYLVFLVERSEAHADAILLLDEPGLSLHPLAQRDLSEFFDGLAETNQLLYTSHSPFLIDADRLDRARKVYVDETGTSRVTPDLSVGDGDAEKRGAGYAVHAALWINCCREHLRGLYTNCR